MLGQEEENPVRSGFWRVIGRELRRIRSERRYFLLMVVFPILSLVVTWGALKSGTPREMPVAVCDLDGSAWSRKLIRLMDAGPGVATRSVADPAQGRDLVLRGQVYALVILPVDLERSLLRGRGAEVVCYYNTQSLLVGSLISRDLARVVGTVSAEVEAGLRLSRGQSRPEVMARLEPIQPAQHVLFDPQLNYLYFLGAAFAPTLLHLFIVFTGVMALGSELKEGTANVWLRTAGESPWKAVAGKLSVYWAWFSFLGLALLFWLHAVVGVPQHGSGAMLAGAVVLMTLAALSTAVVAVTLFPSLRMATSAASFYAGTAFAFAGVTFPLAGMMPLARAWSELIPLSHFMRIWTAQAISGAAARSVWPDMLSLLSFLMVGLATVPFLGRHLRDTESWGLL